MRVLLRSRYRHNDALGIGRLDVDICTVCSNVRVIEHVLVGVKEGLGIALGLVLGLLLRIDGVAKGAIGERPSAAFHHILQVGLDALYELGQIAA